MIYTSLLRRNLVSNHEQEAPKKYYIEKWANDKDLLSHLQQLGWYSPDEVQVLYDRIQDLSHEVSMRKVDEQE